MLTRANSKAYAVLSIVINELDDSEFKKMIIEPYLNGRESGFSVYFSTGDIKLVFSESRRSDDIVVYEGRPYEFHPSNTLTEEIYRNGLVFGQNDYCLVAKHIVSKLRGE